jgi:hypothetical protein
VVAPYVFVDHRPVGCMGTVRSLVGSGQFEHLLRAEPRPSLYSPTAWNRNSQKLAKKVSITSSFE